ncbi:MAG: hypothetical protein IH862_01015 [Chloroflexi bacterium]|nr:hypothetical protein [Chloroflexota bacterium]
MKVYLTARFARKDEMSSYAEDLKRLGHAVTSRWLEVEFDPGTPLSHPNWSQLAQQDLDDIRRADALVCFTETSGGGSARHVEFGIGLGLGKRVYIVGSAEHLFHTLPQLEVYPDWNALMRAMNA